MAYHHIAGMGSGQDAYGSDYDTDDEGLGGWWNFMFRRRHPAARAAQQASRPPASAMARRAIQAAQAPRPPQTRATAQTARLPQIRTMRMGPDRPIQVAQAPRPPQTGTMGPAQAHNDTISAIAKYKAGEVVGQNPLVLKALAQAAFVLDQGNHRAADAYVHLATVIDRSAKAHHDTISAVAQYKAGKLVGQNILVVEAMRLAAQALDQGDYGNADAYVVLAETIGKAVKSLG